MKELSSTPHTYKRLDGEFAHLRLLMTTMGHEVHRQFKDALTAFKTGDSALAREVMLRDNQVDQLA
ncbi:MAG: PhoU domain-containing protein [Methylococcus sp.]